MAMRFWMANLSTRLRRVARVMPRSLAAWTWLPAVSARARDDEFAFGSVDDFEVFVVAGEFEEDFDGVGEVAFAGLGGTGRFGGRGGACVGGRGRNGRDRRLFVLETLVR